MCNCCKCHCEAFVSARKFGLLVPVNTTSYIPVVDTEKCIGCGKCNKVCPMDAITVSKNEIKINPDLDLTEENKITKKCAGVNKAVCLGCGVCVKNCPVGAIKLERRKEQVITPVTTVHRVVLAAIEKGQLQNLIFDNSAYKSHKAMAAILAVILKLPPVHKLMASKQMKSVYLAKLLENS